MVQKAAIAVSVLWVVSVLVFTQGCFLVAAGAAAGGVLYAKGDLEAIVDGKPGDIAAATEKAFAEMNISKRSAVSSGLDAEVVGRTATDKNVTIRVKAKTEKQSDISIRIGTLGDEALSRILLNKIREKL